VVNLLWIRLGSLTCLLLVVVVLVVQGSLAVAVREAT